MSRIEVFPDKVADAEAAIAVCPFGAIERDKGGALFVSSGCRMCRACVRRFPEAFKLVEDRDASFPAIDKNAWRGIVVVAELSPGGAMHPVALELLGKARELAAVRGEPVIALVAGAATGDAAAALLARGADEVHVFEDPELAEFRVEPFAAILESFIREKKPSAVLVGGTPVGRSLAPRVAARFHAGLTADCTSLGMSEEGDLDQIRPAYGGNIMAHINTPRHRPQFATVRYKVFQIPPKERPHGTVVRHETPPGALTSRIEILRTEPKPPERGIEDAEALVVCGRGVRRREDIAMLQALADALGGRVAATRAVVEAGWLDAKCQIGISGRTVKPKLIVTCGVSGAIQFVSGMSAAGTIVAINTAKDAPIFSVAHIGIVGDLYDVVPALTGEILARKESSK